MAHWENRDEENWRKFSFNQPYAKGLRRLREDVLAKTDFDPATLWQWGTMQALAVIGILKACESAFGAEGQKLVYDALQKVGHDIGRQILEGTDVPQDMTAAEHISFYATVVNRIAYASLEDPRIDSNEKASFDILWCPHQDTYKAFDCRVQRYFVRGMIDAYREHTGRDGFDVRFDCTIPAGAPTCHFTMWKGDGDESSAWNDYTRSLEEKALRISRAEKD
ncbi:MAG: hypothetical protein ACE5FC_02750 [Myxococcota bacterium]